MTSVFLPFTFCVFCAFCGQNSSLPFASPWAFSRLKHFPRSLTGGYDGVVTRRCRSAANPVARKSMTRFTTALVYFQP